MFEAIIQPLRPPPLIFGGPLLLLLATAAGACGTQSEPGSCYRDKDNACTEFGSKESVAGKRLCSGMTWRTGAQSCPSAQRVGTCVVKSGATEYLYGGPPNNYSTSGAKTACESTGGVFTAAAP